MRKRDILLLVTILALAFTGCQAQVEANPETEADTATGPVSEPATPQSLAGDWQGTLKVLGMMTFDVVVHFTEKGDQLGGIIDIPKQGANGLALDNIQIHGNEVRFEMPSNMGVAVFETQLQDGKLTGEYRQAKYKGRIELQRAAAAKEAEKKEAEPEEDLPYRQEEVRVQNGEVTLAGTLTLPEGEGPYPAAILLTGSGPQDRNGEHYSMPGYRPFLWIADHLTRAGIAVLRYDDRAVGESKGGDRLADTTFDFASDAEAAMQYLAERPEIDPDQIGFIGHSEGAWIAAIVASKNSHVAFIVSLGGHAVRGAEVIEHQMKLAVPGEGFSEEEKQRQIASNKKEMELIIAQDWEGLEAFLYEETLKVYREDPNIPKDELEQRTREATQRQLESRKGWFYPFVTENPADDWQKVQSPVLAMWGAQDTSVDPAQNKAPMEAALTRAGNQDFTMVVVPNTGHLFLDEDSGEMKLAPGVLDSIALWISERTGQTTY